MYRLLFSIVLRHVPAETAYHLGFGLIRVVAGVPALGWLLGRLVPRDPVLGFHALGLDFPGRRAWQPGSTRTPVGLTPWARWGSRSSRSAVRHTKPISHRRPLSPANRAGSRSRSTHVAFPSSGHHLPGWHWRKDQARWLLGLSSQINWRSGVTVSPKRSQPGWPSSIHAVWACSMMRQSGWGPVSQTVWVPFSASSRTSHQEPQRACSTVLRGGWSGPSPRRLKEVPGGSIRR